MKVFLFTVLLVALAGCTNRGGDILESKKMQAVLWDIINADVYTEQFIKKDSLKNPKIENMQLQNKIFALHNVTRADFYKSYDYYIAHSDLMKVILDSMSSKAERDRIKMIQRHAGGQPK